MGNANYSGAENVIDETLQAKYDDMREILRSLESVAVAFSAGVDSTLVLKVALDTLGSESITSWPSWRWPGGY